jgi:peroxidase
VIAGSEVLPSNGDHFFAGDIRVNENLGLQNQQIMWLRQHNKIAKKLKDLNPNWSDEDLFQEARHITIAQFQHIIYNEWLEQVVGTVLYNKYKLSPNNYKYDPSINPSIYNEFSTAAFRFGHTLINDILSRVSSTGSIVATELMKDNFFPDKTRYQVYN